MAVYKVPQDVEAEDKLIGPFSFRQFIYLIVAALGIFLSWALAQVFIGLLILPLPIVIAFLALALPLRKDQPMETYLIAMIKFFFKPRNRIWDPEGTISLVQITAPTITSGPQMKGYGSDEAAQRLAYLAQVVDTKGWSTRGATSAHDNMSDIFVAEATHVEDVYDSSSMVAQSLEQKIVQADAARRQAARATIQSSLSSAPLVTPTSVPNLSADASQLSTDTPVLDYDPYPSSMHQRVLDPNGTGLAPQPEPTPQPEPQKQPSPETVSPDIMRLANNNDLSISALSREAHRIENNSDEVVISLR
ncbi:MAG: PrgI family protein [Candidatus Saccharimonadales bacterium]